jgi:predicted transcriptional regulator of viral defense system
MAADTALDELALPQAGVVSGSQLLAAGWSSRAIDRGLARGRLTRVARGVYRVSGAPWGRRAAQHAALLLVGHAATLARWSAAEARNRP